MRSYQGAITALTATAPIATQPAPLASAAAKSCHGAAAVAHPMTPTAAMQDPATIVAGTPNRRCARGRLTTTIAPRRKCSVTADETIASGQRGPFDDRMEEFGGRRETDTQPKMASTKAARTTRVPKKE